jgi:hypothetical protein
MDTPDEKPPRQKLLEDLREIQESDPAIRLTFVQGLLANAAPDDAACVIVRDYLASKFSTWDVLRILNEFVVLNSGIMPANVDPVEVQALPGAIFEANLEPPQLPPATIGSVPSRMRILITSSLPDPSLIEGPFVTTLDNDVGFCSFRLIEHALERVDHATAHDGRRVRMLAMMTAQQSEVFSEGCTIYVFNAHREHNPYAARLTNFELEWIMRAGDRPRALITGALMPP